MTTRAAGQPFNIFVSDWEDAPARLPAGVRAWAIGDVHGQLTHLDALLAAVRTMIDAAPPGPRHLVLMGDYIDRGPDNIAALERAGNLEIPGVAVTALRGNHEDYLDRFLHDDAVGEDLVANWVVNGGNATLANLGVSEGDLRERGAAAVARAVRTQPLAGVRRALARLEIGLRLGGYFFVHAGVHPRFPLHDAMRQRLKTIREPFLAGEGWIHDFAVVHGHSIIGPDIAPHRIAVDSGAFWTGVLSCVELRDDQARFILATRDGDLERLRRIPGRRPLSAERWRRLATAA
ncbi:MAG TPA: metallophosphoesterase [Caulobacteraceae bacterium]|nr:metallophosphoesterase [Caulobacteraceae bacterium]